MGNDPINATDPLGLEPSIGDCEFGITGCGGFAGTFDWGGLGPHDHDSRGYCSPDKSYCGDPIGIGIGIIFHIPGGGPSTPPSGDHPTIHFPNETNGIPNGFHTAIHTLSEFGIVPAWTSVRFGGGVAVVASGSRIAREELVLFGGKIC